MNKTIYIYIYSQETTVSSALQSIEDNCSERLFRSTNKRNAM